MRFWKPLKAAVKALELVDALDNMANLEFLQL